MAAQVHAPRISARDAAAILNCHYKTVIGWAKAALDGEPSPLRDVACSATGRYSLSREEVEQLRATRARRSCAA